jgi:diguanylate cyclase (GGDEF)-like protein
MPTESKSIITTTVGEIPSWMLVLLAVLALTSLGALFLWLRGRRRKEPVINVLATEDPETGFANHDAFETRLDEEWRRAQQFGNPLGLMSLELDGFAEHSDLITESELADLLQEISLVMRTELRPTDIIARPASGEFAVICPETDIGELVDLRSNLERKFEADERITWDFNIGVAEAGQDVQDSYDLVAHAHDALASRQRAHLLSLAS